MAEPGTESSDPSSDEPQPEEPKRRARTWALLSTLALGIMFVLAWRTNAAEKGGATTISYTTLHELVDGAKVEEITFRGQTINGKLKAAETIDGKSVTAFETTLPPLEDRELLARLREKGVKVEARAEESNPLLSVALSLLPWLAIGGVWIWLSRRAQRSMARGPGGILGNRDRRLKPKPTKGNVTFDDVAGLKGPKQDLREIVDFLKEPERFRRLGAKVPRGVLLVGPPGTGKTLLARAVAGEANVPFFSVSASEFIELFVGMGASRVRELFAEARKVAPAILFIDEIDAVGRSRGTGLGGGNDEREQTLNQMLSEMDGFSRNDLTIVLAATNRPDVLDPALLRPGRFDRRVLVDRPELAAREAILKLHARNKPLGVDVDLHAVASLTPGFSGADLANLVNEAALGATRAGQDAITAADFSEAYDKIVLGDPRETVLDPIEKRRVAVHESGHALLAHFTPGAQPLERVSIIPRGMALGVTHQTPAANRHLLTQIDIEARLRVLMGGYAAEATLLGGTSSGAEHDLKKATELASAMIANYGMSERVGPVFHEHRTEHPFLGQRLASDGQTSDATVRLIEEETRRVLTEAAADAKACIVLHRRVINALVERLLEEETLEKDALNEVLGVVAEPSPRILQADAPS